MRLSRPFPALIMSLVIFAGCSLGLALFGPDAGAAPVSGTTGLINFSAATQTVTEGDNVELILTRTSGSDGAIDAFITDIGGTATSSLDYVDFSGVSVTWADGDTSSRTITIATLTDALTENAETISIQLIANEQTTAANVAGPTNQTIITIEDDPLETGLIDFITATQTVTEGDNVELILTRTSGSDGAIDAFITDIGGTATSNLDYPDFNGVSVAWADGDTTSRTITIPTFTDAVTEPDETLTIQLIANEQTTAANVAGPTNQTTITIREAATTTELCDGRTVTIDMNTNGGSGTGTPNNDVILGTTGNDIIFGLGGDDVICAGGGLDTVFGGDGEDMILGGPGDDLLAGEDGADTINGGGGHDTITGDNGWDRITGSTGNDIINGGNGNDWVWAGPGTDEIDGGPGNDLLLGFDGDDTIVAGGGNDLMNGMNGDDDIEGGDGFDQIWGGLGNDHLKGQGGFDWIWGRWGQDTIEGGYGNDQLFGEGSADLIYGGPGNDLINGGIGTDDLRGNAGNDTIEGGDQNDTMIGGPGNDTFDGGFGTDSCNGNTGTDSAINCETQTNIP